MVSSTIYFKLSNTDLKSLATEACPNVLHVVEQSLPHDDFRIVSCDDGHWVQINSPHTTSTQRMDVAFNALVVTFRFILSLHEWGWTMHLETTKFLDNNGHGNVPVLQGMRFFPVDAAPEGIDANNIDRNTDEEEIVRLRAAVKTQGGRAKAALRAAADTQDQLRRRQEEWRSMEETHRARIDELKKELYHAATHPSQDNSRRENDEENDSRRENTALAPDNKENELERELERARGKLHHANEKFEQLKETFAISESTVKSLKETIQQPPLPPAFLRMCQKTKVSGSDNNIMDLVKVFLKYEKCHRPNETIKQYFFRIEQQQLDAVRKGVDYERRLTCMKSVATEYVVRTKAMERLLDPAKARNPEDDDEAFEKAVKVATDVAVEACTFKTDRSGLEDGFDLKTTVAAVALAPLYLRRKGASLYQPFRAHLKAWAPPVTTPAPPQKNPNEKRVQASTVWCRLIGQRLVATEVKFPHGNSTTFMDFRDMFAAYYKNTHARVVFFLGHLQDNDTVVVDKYLAPHERVNEYVDFCKFAEKPIMFVCV